MAEIVHGKHIGEWVALQMGGLFDVEHSQAIGLQRNGELVAGIIYENWNGKSVVCHIAIRGRITPEFLSVISQYAYVQCGAHKIIAPASSDNRRSVDMLRKMGFREECRIRNAQPGGDICLFTMTKDSCKYLSERYGKKSNSSANA